MNKALQELKADQDWYDPWGASMYLALAICTELDLRGEETPTGLSYRPGACGSHHDDDFLQSIVESHTSEDLFKAAEILDRYLDLLKRQGKDY